MVAISIPIFSAQLEKAKEATDLANIRSAYAECSAAVLSETDDGANGVTYTEADGTASKSVAIKQATSGWLSSGEIVGNDYGTGATSTNKIPDVKVGDSVTVTVKADGTWTCVKN
ncbi:MAG: hypothetical protein IK151_05590 [Erysipelotrichaceae bacterium]|nr:hypothetical protein [Erysipelotrichaceae bacterium]